MDIFDLLTMIGGLSLFLFGMTVMGQALERRAGGQLEALLSRFTSRKLVGVLTGLVVTAVIQSSSATTVMVIGFVNSGLMSLRQAIYVIMGANVGTTVTAWILSLAGIDGGSFWLRLLKPSSFTPVLALVGIIFYMFRKGRRNQDTGLILLGFATLMFGMETMSGAVAGLGEQPWFRQLFVVFQNPVLGVLAGAVLTAVIQSSSASVGILQALAATGQITYGAAAPIIMGQNIGTCATAMLSSVGTNRNARRAAVVHLLFNVIGTLVWLTVFCLVKWAAAPAVLEESATLLGIAGVHTAFNLLCAAVLVPLSGVLERAVDRLVPDGEEPEAPVELDPRLLSAPAVALDRCREVAAEMAGEAVGGLREALAALKSYTPELAQSVRRREERTDHYEDSLGTYLIQLSARPIGRGASAEAARLLRGISDLERIGDHGVNLVESAEEMAQHKTVLTGAAREELWVLMGAVEEIMTLALGAFLEKDPDLAARVEPLEEVVDRLKEELRGRHILRMQRGECSMETGFIWSDLLTDLERVADHCSNLAGGVTDMLRGGGSLHGSLRDLREDSETFRRAFEEFRRKYALPEGSHPAGDKKNLAGGGLLGADVVS